MKLRRPANATLASLAVHVVVIALLAQVLIVPGRLQSLFEKTPVPQPERIGFVALPRVGETDPGRSGGDGRPVTKTPPGAPRQLVAPVAVPTTLPSAPAAASPEPAGGSGERIGEGGPTVGVRPSYADPRVWAPVGPMVTLPMTPAERLDRTLKSDIQRHNDSLATHAYQPNKLERGDWTIDGPGGKWGVDSSRIRLGKFSLPSAVLALLPLNMQGGRNAAGGQDLVRARAFAAIRADIDWQSQRMLNEEELRVAAKRIRERKDRERREGAPARPQGEDAAPRNAAPSP